MSDNDSEIHGYRDEFGSLVIEGAAFEMVGEDAVVRISVRQESSSILYSLVEVFSEWFYGKAAVTMTRQSLERTQMGFQQVLRDEISEYLVFPTLDSVSQHCSFKVKVGSRRRRILEISITNESDQFSGELTIETELDIDMLNQACRDVDSIFRFIDSNASSST